MMDTFHLANLPLLALLLLPALVLLHRERRGGAAFGGFPLAAEALRRSYGPLVLRVLLTLGLALLVTAALRPQFGRPRSLWKTTIARDLMLVIDLSGSMRVDDLAAADGKRSDRLSAVFEAARRFIDNRPNDRLGLVFFGTTALTSCPLTHDHDTVIQFLERTERQQRSRWSRRGMDDPEAGLLGSATNLGLGLGSALRCLKDTAAKGRAVILITDGADTRQLPNWVDPLEAARRTEGMGVRVYGIGVGNPQGSFTINDAWGNVRLIPLAQVPEFLPDMPRLASIAKLAHGQAFAANDRAGLDQVFREIDRLEPTERTVPTVEDSTDLYWPLLAAGLVAIGLALALEPRLRGVA